MRLFPEVMAAGRVSLAKVRAVLGEVVEDDLDRYAFTWPGRPDALRLLAEPSQAHLLPAGAISAETSENLFIEGDNLEALKLLRETHAGRVKMIYIDPPYNTGGAFVYRDRFPVSEKRRGNEGRSEGVKEGTTVVPSFTPSLLPSALSGRRHGAWLTMIYPRLWLARELLRPDGVIFVSIDDHEVHHLRLLMDEIFGEACFKNCIIFRRGIKSVQAQFATCDALAVGHEYVLMYARSPEARFPKLHVPRDEARPGTWNNHWRGTERPTMRYELLGITPARGQWRWSRARSLAAIANYERLLADLGTSAPSSEEIDAWYHRERERAGGNVDLLRVSATGKPEHYVPPSETRLGSDLWTDINPRGSAELDEIFGRKVFDHPKPVALIQRMLQFATDARAGDIVLDFFAGACTTAHAVLAMNRNDGGNRRFLMIQSPEPLPSVQTLADGTVLRTIADVGRERIRRVMAHLGWAGVPADEATGCRTKDWAWRSFHLESAEGRHDD